MTYKYKKRAKNYLKTNNNGIKVMKKVKSDKKVKKIKKMYWQLKIKRVLLIYVLEKKKKPKRTKEKKLKNIKNLLTIKSKDVILINVFRKGTKKIKFFENWAKRQFE